MAGPVRSYNLVFTYSCQPFAAGEPADTNGGGPSHEHPPWTATSRGIETSLRRLAMLEPVYRLAPDLLRSGRVNRPADNTAASREVRMTDFRLLRHGGFYHVVARYGPDLWTPFTYAGLHATERALRRKEQHRFWGVDCYSHEEDRYLRIGNRLFYEDPDQAVQPSGQIVVAHDAWARELARNTLSNNTPTLFCTPDGQCSEAVELRPSRDLVSDPSGHPNIGRPENVGLWLRQNPDMEAIDGRTAHRLFLTICQFPAMRASWLREVVGRSSGEVSRHLERFVQTGLVAVFEGRHYLSELGMRRAANMSRILPSVIRSRHEAYLDRWYREHEQHHNDGVNRLVARFAREGVEVVAGWRSEVNLPGLTRRGGDQPEYHPAQPHLLAQTPHGWAIGYTFEHTIHLPGPANRGGGGGGGGGHPGGKNQPGRGKPSRKQPQGPQNRNSGPHLTLPWQKPRGKNRPNMNVSGNNAQSAKRQTGEPREKDAREQRTWDCAGTAASPPSWARPAAPNAPRPTGSPAGAATPTEEPLPRKRQRPIKQTNGRGTEYNPQHDDHQLP